MTRTLIEAGVLLMLVVGALFGYGEFRERLAEGDAERERLENRVHAAESARAAVDSAARLRIARLTSSMDSLQREASRLDTVLEVRADTVLRMVPDAVRPAVEDLIATCHERIGVCEERADSLDSVLFVKDGQLAASDSSHTAKDSLILQLQDQLDPSLFDSLFGGLPGTALKLGIGAALYVALTGG